MKSICAKNCFLKGWVQLMFLKVLRSWEDNNSFVQNKCFEEDVSLVFEVFVFFSDSFKLLKYISFGKMVKFHLGDHQEATVGHFAEVCFE